MLFQKTKFGPISGPISAFKIHNYYIQGLIFIEPNLPNALYKCVIHPHNSKDLCYHCQYTDEKTENEIGQVTGLRSQSC